MMRKLSLFAAVSILSATAFAFPDIFPKDRGVLVKYDIAVAAATTSTKTLVIDLSDTTNYPHEDTREINIIDLRVSVDKLAASTGTVKIGVVNFVNASTGSVTWFREFSSEKNASNTASSEYIPSLPSTIRTRVNSTGNATDGETPYILSNDTTLGSTTFQTDQVLPSALGTDTAPGRGDIVLEIAKDSSNAWNLIVEVLYFAE